MARYHDAVCRRCRREKMKLFLKGEKCFTEKCPVSRRTYPPGEHGQRRMKETEYYTQLREKQKAKSYYGILERQFRNYYEVAAKQRGITGENLLRLLERRLDNVVYHAGFAFSRPEARQLILHRHFAVNGRTVNVPSFLVKPGDVVTVTHDIPRIKESIEMSTRPVIPPWLELDRDHKVVKVTGLPEREDIDAPVEEKLIVELYSK